MVRRLFIAFLLFITARDKVDASHFRGGTVSWKYLGQVGASHQVEINYRLAWPNSLCNAALVRAQTAVYPGSSWVWQGNFVFQNIVNQTTAIKCTSFDNTDGWAYGYNSFIATVTPTGPFHVSYRGSAWIGAALVSGGWALSATNIDFAIRSDTSAANNPPRTLSRPVMRFIQGCPEDIRINYLDDDNDRVRCRYAGSDPNAPVDECSGTCNGPSNTGYSHFTLNETTCTITYDGGGGTITVGVSLMLEDYPRSNITLNGTRSVSTSDSLSQIPLQFAVQVITSSSCNVVPTYPNNTIQNGQILTLPSGGSLNATINAFPSSSSYTITQFVVIGPLGLQYTAAAHIGSNLYESVLTWAPGSSEIGDHTVCYYAVDSGRRSGKVICFLMRVISPQDPCEIDNGGCSDICTRSGPGGLTPTCSCSESCWSLQRDRKTCSPHMNVTCDGNGMHVSVAKCASNRTVIAGNAFSHFTQNRCKSSIVDGNHYFSMGLIDCGITLQANPVQLQYNTHLWIWDPIDTGSSVITRGHYRVVPVACSLPVSSNITGSFIPQLPFNNETFPVDVNIEGIGSFSLYFQFYRDANYTTALSPADYPLRVTVNEQIYFSVGALGQPGFVFFTEECVASSSLGTDLLTYTFMQDGCGLGPTLRREASNNAMEDRFRIQAFEFRNNLATDRQRAEISIQCKVRICSATDNSSRCSQGCIPSVSLGKRSIYPRIKRHVDDDGDYDDEDDIDDIEIVDKLPTMSESPLQEVKARLLLLLDTDTPETVTSESPIYTNWILIGIGGALLLIALFVAQRVVRARRFKSSKKPFGGDIEFYKNKIPIDTNA